MSKRQQSPDLIPNPFIKKRNLAWTIDDTKVEPLTPTKATPSHDHRKTGKVPSAAIEAGQATITDHLEHFTALLASHIRPSPQPQLSIPDYASLYASSIDNAHGAHFVIHQHDHPVAGTHYDLRLQINGTSSASWAIMYGLPGDANSSRLNRNATETRIHCLWNHLVETASAATGSLIIWDTGSYSILPRTSKYAPSHDPSSPTSSPSSPSSPPKTQQQLLHEAFRNRKIRLRLHGSKLPDPYVLNLRLTKPEDRQGRMRAGRTPRFRRKKGQAKAAAPETSCSSNDEDTGVKEKEEEEEEEAAKPAGTVTQDPHITSATERELLELEDASVRASNAYPGARNSIGSVHQRKWYLSLDREACGFVKSGRRWIMPGKEDADAERDEADGRLEWPFYVKGVEEERSVVTGRRGADVLKDEEVKGFVGRKGWRPVLN